jgi:hypothetical protein
LDQCIHVVYLILSSNCFFSRALEDSATWAVRLCPPGPLVQLSAPIAF